MDLCNAVNCRVDYIAVHRYGGLTLIKTDNDIVVPRYTSYNINCLRCLNCVQPIQALLKTSWL